MDVLEIHPTIAMRQGKAWIDQCAWCGLVAVVSDLASEEVKESRKLGPCPACGRTTWWAQRLPLAGLRLRESLERREAADFYQGKQFDREQSRGGDDGVS